MKFEIWWIWMGLAAILLIAEIFTAGFFLLWFSIGAAGAGVLALLGVSRPGQFIVFVLVSGILFVFGRRFAEQVTEKQPPGIGADRSPGTGGISASFDNVCSENYIPSLPERRPCWWDGSERAVSSR